MTKAVQPESCKQHGAEAVYGMLVAAQYNQPLVATCPGDAKATRLLRMLQLMLYNRFQHISEVAQHRYA